MIETPLAKRLALAAARPDPLIAFKLARRWFKDCRRIEMQELAAELGVNRATLFRWVGGRDELLAEVIWSLTDPTFRIATAQASTGRTRSGPLRIAATMGCFAALANEAENFRTFLRREPERALRILTTRASSFQQRLVTSVEKLLQEETSAGTIDPPLPLHDLAYLIVRIAEAFIYSNLITGEAPDAAKVEQATAVLLGAGHEAAQPARAVRRRRQAGDAAS